MSTGLYLRPRIPGLCNVLQRLMLAWPVPFCTTGGNIFTSSLSVYSAVFPPYRSPNKSSIYCAPCHQSGLCCVWIPAVLSLQSQVNLSLWPTTSPVIQIHNVGRLQGAVWLLAPLLTEQWQQLQAKIITHPGHTLPPIFWEVLLCNFKTVCSWKRKRSSGYFTHDIQAKSWQVHTKR